MAVTVVNQWHATQSLPSGFSFPLPRGKSAQVTVASTTGNWLIALLGWQAPPGYATTMSVGDDAGNYWVPLGAPAGTSSAAGNVRCSAWAAPYALAAASVWAAPTGYTPGFGVLVLEVAGMGPGLSLSAVDTWWANAATSVSVALPSPPAPVLMLACGASDNNAVLVSMPGGGWSPLTAVTASNGSDHTADLTLTSGWQVTSGAAAASWAASEATDLAACAVALTVNQAAPAGPQQGWPAEQFQAAFGAGITTPWDQLAWTDLTPRYQGMSGQRGKQYELDSVQAAAMPLTLSNNDGWLTPGNTGSPYYQGVAPWTPARGAALYLSQDYAWSGPSSMLMAPDGLTASPGAVSEQVAAVAGSSYTGTAAVLSPQGWASGVQAVLTWYGAGGTVVGASPGPVVPATAGQWAYPQVTDIAPPGTTAASLTLQAAATPAATTLFYWDFCQLTGPAGFVLNANFNFATGPQVYTPVRLLGTWAGRTYTQWRGFAERWPQSLDQARYTVSNSNAVDVWAGLTALLPTVGRGEILADNPYAYWPCSDAAGSTMAANVAPTGTGPLVVTQSKFGSGTNGAQTFGANSNAFTGDPSGTTWQQSGLAGGGTDVAHGWCLKYQAADLPPPSRGVTIETFHSFTSGIADPNDELIVWVMRGTGGPVAYLWASYSGIGGGLGWYISVVDKTTGNTTTTNVFPFGIEEGWFHFAVTLTSRRWTVTINGGQFTPSVASGPCNLSDNAGWISWAGSSDPLFTGGFADIALAHLAIYPAVLPANRITAHYWALTTGQAGDDSADSRMERLLGFGSMLVARRTGSHGDIVVPATDIQGQAVSQNLTNLAQSDAGLLSVDRSGYLAYQARRDRWNLPVQWAVGELAGAVLNANWDFEAGVAPWTPVNASGTTSGVTVTQGAQAFTGSSSMQVTPAPVLGAAPSVVAQGNSGGTVTSFTVPVTGAVPAGSNVIAGIGGNSNTAAVSLSDSAGNTWTLAGSSLTAGVPVWIYQATLTNPLTGASTLTVTTSSQVVNVIAVTVPGTSGAGTFVSATGTGTIQSVATGTLPSPPAWVIGFGHNGGVAPSWQSPAASLALTSGGGGGFFTAAYAAGTSPSGVTIAASTSASEGYTIAAVPAPAATSGPGAQSELAAVTPSALYAASAWLFSPGGWGAGARLQVNWFTGSGSYVSTSTGPPSSLPAGQWVPVTFGVTPPASAAYASLVISMAGNVTSGPVVYADQAQLVQPGEIPYLGDIAWDFDPSLVFDDLTLNQFGGTTITASSATSMAQYGDQTLQETTYLADAGLTADLADSILATYGTPSLRAAQFTVDPSANPYAWPFVLSADVGTVVQITRRLQGTRPVITGMFTIQSITPQIVPGSHPVRYSATPYFAGITLATNDPVRGRPDGTHLLPW